MRLGAANCKCTFLGISVKAAKTASRGKLMLIAPTNSLKIWNLKNSQSTKPRAHLSSVTSFDMRSWTANLNNQSRLLWTLLLILDSVRIGQSVNSVWQNCKQRVVFSRREIQNLFASAKTNIDANYLYYYSNSIKLIGEVFEFITNAF